MALLWTEAVIQICQQRGLNLTHHQCVLALLRQLTTAL